MKQDLKYTAEKNCELVPALREYLRSQGVPESILLNCDIDYNGMPLDCKHWETTTLNAGDVVDIYPNVYFITSALVASALAISATSFAAIAIAAAANFIIGMAVSFVVNWAVSKLFPTPKPKGPANTPDVEALPTITGATNAYRPFESAQMIVGETRTTPDFAVKYYSVVQNGQQKIRHLFCVSAGAVDVWDIRKEDTPITDLSVNYKIYSGWTGQPILNFDDTITPILQDFDLAGRAVFTAESPVGVYKVGLVVAFPQGLRSENMDSGAQYAQYAEITFNMTDEDGNSYTFVRNIRGERYKSSWMGYLLISLPHASKWTAKISGWYAQKNHDLSNYKDGKYMYRYIAARITELQWHKPEPSVKYTGKSMTLLMVEAIATDKLSGGLNTINCMARLRGMKADGTTVISSNPALQARRILKDPNIINNTEFVTIDDASFAAFEAHCDKYGFTVNGVESEGRRTGEVLSDMLEIGQGYIDNASGLYTIVYDNPANPIVDKINSRNSWGMTIAHSFNILPVDGLRINFNNVDRDYQVDERLVYENGSPQKNIQQMSNKFITNPALAWKYGMMNLAMDKLRNAIYTFNTDWRSIDYKLGQKLQLSHPLFFLGIGTAGKVVDYVRDGALYTAVVLDQYYPTTIGKQYILQSSNKYATQFWDIKAIDNETTNTLYFQTPISAASVLPELDLMLVFGETEKSGVDVLIRNITRNANFTAEVECAPATDIYAALSGEIPDFESPLTFPTFWGGAKPNTPKITSVNIILDTASGYGDDSVHASAVLRISYAEKENVEFSHYIIGVRVTTDHGEEPDLPVVENPDGTEEVVADISNSFDYYTGYEKSSFTLEGVYNDVDYELTIKAVSTKGIESDISTFSYSPEKLFEELPDIEGFSVSIYSPDALRFSWGRVNGYDPVSYIVGGDIAFDTLELSVISRDLSGKTGPLSFTVYAKDKVGRNSSVSAPKTITVNAPKTPSVTSRTKTDGLWMLWNDCKNTWPVRHYVVKDVYTGKVSILYDEQLDVTPRPAGEYRFEVQALDVHDNYGGKAVYTMTVGDIATPVPALKVSGGVLRIEWKGVLSDFPLDKYEIYDMNSVLLHTTKTTFYDVPPDAENAAGVIGFKIRALDTVGNASDYAVFSTTLSAPVAPSVTVRIHQDKRQVVVSWNTPRSQVPIEGYEVFAQYAQEGIIKEASFGFFDANTVFLEALSADVDGNMYTFFVRARNYMGMNGALGTQTLQIQRPTAPVQLTKTVTDNNILLSWQPPVQSSFAIKEYIVLRQEGNETSRAELYEEIGRIDSQFFGRFESKAGEYAYKIIPVDWANNEGAAAIVLAYVDQPPDYTVFTDYTSTLNGAKTNAELDGDGKMLMPVIVGETWEQNVERIGLGADLTWEQKDAAGHKYYQSPAASYGSYVEVHNVNAVIAAGRILVTPMTETVEGAPVLATTIETSLDGDVWSIVGTNVSEIYATGFQYIRYTLNVSGGLIYVSELNFVVDIKLRKDNGVVSYDASLGLDGVWVPFRTKFIDVQGIPLCQVNESTHDNPLTAYVLFEDVPNPTGFHVFVLDKNGTPTSATVTWLANGV